MMTTADFTSMCAEPGYEKPFVAFYKLYYTIQLVPLLIISTTANVTSPAFNICSKTSGNAGIVGEMYVVIVSTLPALHIMNNY